MSFEFEEEIHSYLKAFSTRANFFMVNPIPRKKLNFILYGIFGKKVWDPDLENSRDFPNSNKSHNFFGFLGQKMTLGSKKTYPKATSSSQRPF